MLIVASLSKSFTYPLAMYINLLTLVLKLTSCFFIINATKRLNAQFCQHYSYCFILNIPC